MILQVKNIVAVQHAAADSEGKVSKTLSCERVTDIDTSFLQSASKSLYLCFNLAFSIRPVA